MSHQPTSTPDTFSGNFTQQEAIPEDAIAAALEVMRSGRLHRYNVAKAGEISETAQLEIDYARYQNQRYCLACASGGYALQIAMRAWGLQPGQTVLTNAFTLSPVPGAIQAVGGKPVLIETTEDLVIDLEHLDSRIRETNAKLLLLSHMRGHLVDMEALCTLLERHSVALIEDCAHTMGASFNGRMSGTHGVLSCFSTQTYKHINSGEGGLLSSDDDTLMARAIILSGSYMLFERHEAAPAPEVFKEIKLQTPNCSGRMDNLRAAILRPQLANLDNNGRRWNERYDACASALGSSGSNSIKLPTRHPKAYEVPSSIQFRIPRLKDEQNQQFLSECANRGVDLKWFGAGEPAAYTSRYDSWQYMEHTALPKTDEILSRLYDCRLPLTFSVEQCRTIGAIISDVESQIG